MHPKTKKKKGSSAVFIVQLKCPEHVLGKTSPTAGFLSHWMLNDLAECACWNRFSGKFVLSFLSALKGKKKERTSKCKTQVLVKWCAKQFDWYPKIIQGTGCMEFRVFLFPMVALLGTSQPQQFLPWHAPWSRCQEVSFSVESSPRKELKFLSCMSWLSKEQTEKWCHSQSLGMQVTPRSAGCPPGGDNSSLKGPVVLARDPMAAL